MNDANSVLVARDLCKVYTTGPEPVEVIKSNDFSIGRGEMTAIVGSSGSGKSTLLNLLAGLDTPSSGEVLICQQSLSDASEKQRSRLRNKHMGFIYQFHHLLPEFTALENVAMPLLIGKVSQKVAYEKSAYLLDKVGLSARIKHKPSELSGGERQRVAIARALVNEPDVVLADEPTGNLDQTTAQNVHELMLQLNQDSDTAFVIVTHNLKLAQSLPTIWQLENGIITLKN